MLGSLLGTAAHAAGPGQAGGERGLDRGRSDLERPGRPWLRRQSAWGQCDVCLLLRFLVVALLLPDVLGPSETVVRGQGQLSHGGSPRS